MLGRGRAKNSFQNVLVLRTCFQKLHILDDFVRSQVEPHYKYWVLKAYVQNVRFAPYIQEALSIATEAELLVDEVKKISANSASIPRSIDKPDPKNMDPYGYWTGPAAKLE